MLTHNYKLSKKDQKRLSKLTATRENGLTVVRDNNNEIIMVASNGVVEQLRRDKPTLAGHLKSI